MYCDICKTTTKRRQPAANRCKVREETITGMTALLFTICQIVVSALNTCGWVKGPPHSLSLALFPSWYPCQPGHKATSMINVDLWVVDEVFCPTAEREWQSEAELHRLCPGRRKSLSSRHTKDEQSTCSYTHQSVSTNWTNWEAAGDSDQSQRHRWVWNDERTPGSSQSDSTGSNQQQESTSPSDKDSMWNWKQTKKFSCDHEWKCFSTEMIQRDFKTIKTLICV